MLDGSRGTCSTAAADNVFFCKEDFMAKDLFSELHTDHQKVKEIMSKIVKASGDISAKGTLFTALEDELIPHLESEEAVFYPALESKEQSHKEALEALEEHLVAKKIHEELKTLDKSDEHWDAKFMVFKEVVEHHIQEEEKKIFAVARKVLSDDEVADIQTLFDQQKLEIKSGSPAA